MEAVNKAKSRLIKFPQLLVECRTEAIMYATCVSLAHEKSLKKGDCQHEFSMFRKCLAKSAAKFGTHI